MNLSILKDLFHYNGNGWWRIPKTSESKTNPQYEHPFGKFAGMSKDFWTFITSGKGHASPAYYWAIAIILGLITMIEVWSKTIETWSKIPIGMGTKWFIFCRVFLSNGIIITKDIIMTYNFFLLWINL